jgi:hypothetical protein
MKSLQWNLPTDYVRNPLVSIVISELTKFPTVTRGGSLP